MVVSNQLFEWSMDMKSMRYTLLATALGLVSLSTQATTDKHTVAVEQISSAAAVSLAQEAVSQCAVESYKVSATVVDLSGNVLAQIRADGAGVHTLDSSRKKAFTSASLKQPTGDLMKLISDKPILQPLQNMDDNLLLLAGGLPIKVNDQLIGAIGVGGAPGGNLDADCAQKAMDKIFK